MKKLSVAVTGCSLVDSLYANVNTSAGAFQELRSKKNGDGGLKEGELTFSDALEKFSGKKYDKILKELTSGEKPTARNLGGPAIVGAINAAQALYSYPVNFSFYGATGKDEKGKFIRSIIKKTPVDIKNYVEKAGDTPGTDVISDPAANNGKGERTFINSVGASYNYTVSDLPESFYKSDIVWVGATALVPSLHTKLSSILKKAKKNGAVTIVNTVYDFINERKNPDKAWPMGDGIEAYKYIDLLLMDWEEARRLSGKEFFGEIMGFFMNSGVGAFAITRGAHAFFVWSSGKIFAERDLTQMPVSAKVDEILAAHPEKKGDTTGCGDNFAGGFVASLLRQLSEGKEKGTLDIYDACAWAAASGGFAIFTVGGTYMEKKKGEKQAELQKLRDAYMLQINRV